MRCTKQINVVRRSNDSCRSPSGNRLSSKATFRSDRLPSFSCQLTTALPTPRNSLRPRSSLHQPRRLERNNDVTEPKLRRIHVCPFVIPTDSSNCLEHITYTPTDGNKTLFRQRALMVSGFPTGLIARRIEKASVDRFKSNASAGKQGFDWVLQNGLERE